MGQGSVIVCGSELETRVVFLCVCVSDMKVDCEPGVITVVWTETGARVDTSRYRLGSCLPNSFSDRGAVFRVDVNDCDFSRMVSVCVCVRLLTTR